MIRIYQVKGASGHLFFLKCKRKIIKKREEINKKQREKEKNKITQSL